jgi:predicted Rdx family selenoprotein
MTHLGNEFLATLREVADAAIQASIDYAEFERERWIGETTVFGLVRKVGKDPRIKILQTFVEEALKAGSGEQFWLACKGELVPDEVKQSDRPALNGSAKLVDLQQQNECYVELLTAAWLGLYYLGVPYGRAWDAVLIWAEEQGGGLPNGACVGKAIGDIVRGARRAHRAHAAGQCRLPNELLIHSFLPMVIFPELTKEKVRYYEPRNSQVPKVSPWVHELARAYETLQFRLYANEGYPFLYSVPRRFVLKHLETRAKLRSPSNPELVYDDYRKMCEELQDRLQKNGPQDPALRQAQRVVVLHYDRAPACFVNDDIGLFTFEAIDVMDDVQAMPLPATYMHEHRRRRYYQRIKDAEPQDPARNLLLPLNGNEQAHKEMFDYIVHGKPSPVPHPDLIDDQAGTRADTANRDVTRQQ